MGKVAMVFRKKNCTALCPAGCIFSDGKKSAATVFEKANRSET